MENYKIKKADIIVVDDTPENLQLLSRMLSEKEYKVRPFKSGRLAIKAVENLPPDLIILDINMPEMNGYEVCEHLKSNPELRDIPIIFISALSDKFDKVKAFSLGGVDYITKPFHFEVVEARIHTHLTIRNLQIELEKHNKDLQELTNAQVKEISDSQIGTIHAMVKLSESRDDDTGKHIDRTRTFCRILAKYLKGFPEFSDVIDDDFIETIYQASPLHDVGKVGIEDRILLKPGRHTPEEFEIMKTHSVLGARTLNDVKKNYPNNEFINMGIKIAASHHEKWDGSGYPTGLKGEKIPLSARIMAVADVYDALRSKRIYKAAFSHEKSVNIIIEGKGSHFDPRLVDAFIELKKEFDHVRNHMS